jgi:hypothetical protein
VNGKTYEQPLQVLADPRSSASPGDIQAQTAFLLEVRERMTEIAKLVGRIHSLRSQIEAQNERLAGQQGMQQLIEQGQKLIADLEPIELALYSPNAEVTYDILAGRDGGAKLYSRYGWLEYSADPHSGAPTQGMREMADQLDGELQAQSDELQGVVTKDLAALNALAAERGVPYVQ